MAIKTIEYVISASGITPSTEQFVGVQGDHRVTEIKITIQDDLYDNIINNITDPKVMYRFDVYDGEGGIWQSEPKELEKNVQLVLEERHTRFGGKITIYLVITVLSEDNKTEMELYSFPCILRLKNRSEGTYQDGENYESVAGLVETVKNKANEASVSAAVAEKQAQKASTEAINAEKFASDASKALSDIGTMIVESTDQNYSPKSENAQSGKAVAEAVNDKIPKVFMEGAPYRSITVLNGHNDTLPSDNAYHSVWLEDANSRNMSGFIPCRNESGNLTTNTPYRDLDCANKKYVDDLVGDIEAALDELHNYAQAIIGGAE